MVRAMAAAQCRVATQSEEKNASRIADKVFEEHELLLPLPIQQMQHEVVKGLHRSIDSYRLKPQDWVRFLYEEDPRLLGGLKGNLHENCYSFWQAYRLQHPEHTVFEKHGYGDALRFVLPLLLHGDEGRGKRKTGYMVMSFETPFGSTAHSGRPCDCCQYLQDRPFLPSYGTLNEELLTPEVVSCCRKMYTNYKGHSYLSRHLLFGLGKTVYKDNPNVLQDLMEATAQDFKSLFESGVEINVGGRTQTLFGAIVAIKGDLDFHTIYFSLERSYSKVMVRGRVGHICHLCHAAAGSFDPSADCPSFEDFSESPQWRSSLYKTRPWQPEAAPTLSQIPFDRGGGPRKGVWCQMFSTLLNSALQEMLWAALSGYC